MLTLQQLAAAIPGASLAGNGSVQITGIEYDSRAIQPGNLFVALRGGYYDGHAFIDQAIAQGAVAVLAESAGPGSVPTIVAPDTRAALPWIAAEFYGHPSRSLPVIGITGTDGKTSTSYLVDHILRNASSVTGMVGTVSVRIAGETLDHETRQTTPESLEVQRYLRTMADAGVDWAILEATSHGLALHRLDQVEFRIGAVTNITHEHLEFHGTVEQYWRDKAILFERVSDARGTAVVNLDDEGARSVLAYCDGATVLTFSMASPQADIRAAGTVSGITGSRFDLVTPDGTAPVNLPMLGGFNVSNALCAAAIALAAGVSLPMVAEALHQPPTIPGRMFSVNEGQPFSVVVDYAHTPESLTKVLTLLRQLNPEGRLIAVSGSAGERDRTKRPLQGAASATLADISIFTTEDPRFEDADAIIAEIAEGARQAGAEDGRTMHSVTERREALELAFAMAEPGDVVLLAGKGHERSIIWGHEKRPWDEAAVAADLLRAMGFRRSN